MVIQHNIYKIELLIIIIQTQSNMNTEATFEEMKISELKKYCKENGIKGVSDLKKQDIIKKIISSNKTQLDEKQLEHFLKNKDVVLWTQLSATTHQYLQEPTVGGLCSVTSSSC